MKKLLSSYFPGLLLLVFALVVGVTIYKDYGVGWDEPLQRGMGEVSYNYVFYGDQAIKTFRDADHGVAFELVLLFFEKKLGLTDTRDIYLSRHLATHCFFLLSVFVAYLLFYKLFRSNVIACLGFIILAFHPRIYAHSFFNSKDIPFLSMFIISLFVAYTAYRKDRASWYFLLGLSLGFTTSIRILGIMMIAILTLFFFIDFIYACLKKGDYLRVIRHFFLFFCGAGLMLYISWPFLWENPVKNFTIAFNSLAHVAWGSEVLFNGEVYPGAALPASYIPRWFFITTPVLWIVSGIAGILILIYNAVRSPADYFSNTENRNFILYLFCLVVPVGAVIALQSVVYDDWRHLYFVYPSFVVLALYGFNCIWKGKYKLLVLPLCVLQIGSIAFFMIKYHPTQQVYFNELVSHEEGSLKRHYEMDYWGCSYKQGLEYILENDKGDSIRIFWSLHPVINNVNILIPEQRSRIVLVDRGEYPYYFITNYRGRNPKDRFDRPLFHKVEVLNSPVLGVYKVNGP